MLNKKIKLKSIEKMSYKCMFFDIEMIRIRHESGHTDK